MFVSFSCGLRDGLTSRRGPLCAYRVAHGKALMRSEKNIRHALSETEKEHRKTSMHTLRAQKMSTWQRRKEKEERRRDRIKHCRRLP